MVSLEVTVKAFDITPAQRGKYIVHREPDGTTGLYIVNTDGSSEVTHQSIAKRHGLQDANVMGGGQLRVQEGVVLVHGDSTKYGAIPGSAAAEIAEEIARQFRSRNADIKGTKGTAESETGCHFQSLTFWRGLGYSDDELFK